MSSKTVALLMSVGVLAVAPAPALAEWVLVGENANGDRYHVFNQTVTEISAGVVVFDTLIDRAQPEPDGSAVTIDRFVADCRTGSVTNVSWVTLDSNRRIVDSQLLPQLEVFPAQQGTLMQTEVEFACSVVNREARR